MKNLLSLHKRKSMKKLINSVFFIALCSCMAMVSCISDGDDSDTGSIELVAGDKLPVFSVTMNDGRVVTHESLRGKVSFIVFFNTGCKDCRRELPVIQQIYEHHPHMPLIAISRAEDAASVAVIGRSSISRFLMPLRKTGRFTISLPSRAYRVSMWLMRN